MAGQILKRFLCPRCGKGVHLEAKDFKVTPASDRPGDPRWTADPAIECPWDCGAHYFITENRVEFINTI